MQGEERNLFSREKKFSLFSRITPLPFQNAAKIAPAAAPEIITMVVEHHFFQTAVAARMAIMRPEREIPNPSGSFEPVITSQGIGLVKTDIPRKMVKA